MLTLQGIRRLSRFDQVGFLFFDASRRGFWRSFGGALVCLPIWTLAEYQQVTTVHGDAALRFLAIQVTAYVVSWLAYPLLALQVADWFGVWPNYYRYMVAYNWFQPVLQLMWLPLVLLEFVPGSQTAEMSLALWVLLEMVQCAYGWFLARYGLGVSGSTALALAVIDSLLALLIDGIAINL
jgi:hypothetical protein